MVLDSKSFIQLSENLKNNKTVVGKDEIVACLKQAANSDISLAYDRKHFIDDASASMRKVVDMLLHCEIPAEIDSEMIDAIDDVFAEYTKANFNEYLVKELSQHIGEYPNYREFVEEFSNENKEIDSIVEDFFTEKCIFTKNVQICMSDNYGLYLYNDVVDAQPSVYAQQWDAIDGELEIEYALTKTAETVEAMIAQALKNDFEEDDWKSETERVFGSEEAYRRWKGF